MSGMHPVSVIREAIASANRRPWRTLTVALAAAAMCLSVFITTGQSVGVERRVREQMESPTARLVTLTWRESFGGIDPGAVDRIAGLSGVEWTLGRSTAFDLVNTALPGGRVCPSVAIVGDLPPDTVTFVAGQDAIDNEAVVTNAALGCLGLTASAGTLTPASARQGAVSAETFAVVGQVEITEALADIAGFTLVAYPATTELAQVFILAQEARQIAAISEAAVRLTGTANTAAIGVASSSAMIELGAILEQELAANTRFIALAALAAGMGFTGLALALSVGAQRRDFGRRRALGASRTLLMALVILEGAIPATLGALAGTATGVAVLALAHNVTAYPAFIASVPVLAVLAVIISSMPAALVAAFRDPVAILRVP